MNSKQLTQHLNNGVESIIEKIIKGSIFNLKEMLFLSKIKTSFEKAMEKRLESEKQGIHIPPFLISSITQNCNLFCKGCYARANKTCDNAGTKTLLTDAEWGVIFGQAACHGVSFILLAGGEPLLRRDVLLCAADTKDIIFPIITNGTLIDNEYIKLFDNSRNLIPIISIEGGLESTDNRRGEGTYHILTSAIEAMKKRKILYGVSVTVSKENFEEVTSKPFAENLYMLGCKVVLFIEYVPMDNSTREIALDDHDRENLDTKKTELGNLYKKILFISFPGDEKYMGGCLAAGRGFFHINADGAVEPCPFSPYSDVNIKDGGLIGALNSPLFKKIMGNNILAAEHTGGCTLFAQEEKVKELISNKS
ncbi:MAG TPA: radical SAM protein [Clostridiales bacterium]|nr:radical SAM protein [Eubacteriales bacterium]HBR32505.1 radical SAM protein [Clostridiales bacterium]